MIKKRKVIIKSPQQIKNIKESGKYLNELLYKIIDNVKIGVSLLELEAIAESYIQKNRLKGAFKGYHGFPANLCLSLNDCVVHGIPDKYILKSSDVLKIDCGINYNGGISDSAVSLVVGGEMSNPKGFQLIEATKGALDYSLGFIKPGEKIFNYSNSLYNYIKEKGFNVLKNLTGHGVGVELHEPPYLYNYPNPEGLKEIFRPGMVLALEPITSINSHITVEKFGIPRNLYTKNGDIGVQWEYMIEITKDGYNILSGIVDNIYCK